MPRPVQTAIIFLMTALFFVSCKRNSGPVDLSGIEVDMKIERFDRALFALRNHNIDSAIGSFYEDYGDFFDVFNVYVIGIGPASARHYPAYLSMFLNDPTNREVFEYCNNTLGELSAENEMLRDGFRHYLYYYPDSAAPRVIGYVSRFNQGLFTVGDFIGIGLDQYLGSDCPWYAQLGTPSYQLKHKVPERIPTDAMMAWATALYPYNDSVDHVLNRMIHQGMLYYFVDAMYPALPEALKLGFTSDQMAWCRNNEKQMWTHLVEEKLLFSSDPLTIRKLIEDAPHTAYYTTESPGRAAVWQGLQLVRAYARKNRHLSLPDLMAIRDYQEILRGSAYNP